jgi:hypothetical protein
MGGQNVTSHDVDEEDILSFKGILNTDGGGFASIRAPIVAGTGKTFRFTLADREKSGGPFSSAPIRKYDFATNYRRLKKRNGRKLSLSSTPLIGPLVERTK